MAVLLDLGINTIFMEERQFEADGLDFSCVFQLYVSTPERLRITVELEIVIPRLAS